jgi:hypothetical protein
VLARWVPHPYDEELRKNATNGKLRSIPVRMLFNDPDLNLRAEYSMFDRQDGGRSVLAMVRPAGAVTTNGRPDTSLSVTGFCELAKGGHVQALWPAEREDR